MKRAPPVNESTLQGLLAAGWVVAAAQFGVVAWLGPRVFRLFFAYWVGVSASWVVFYVLAAYSSVVDAGWLLAFPRGPRLISWFGINDLTDLARLSIGLTLAGLLVLGYLAAAPYRDAVRERRRASCGEPS